MGNLTINEVRARVLYDHPYFSASAMSLRLIETPGLGTVAVDAGWRLYYDPAALLKWTNEQCVAAFKHEMWHLLRDHHGRQQGRDNSKWNRAGDREINDADDLKRALPPGCLMPRDINMAEGLTAEEYFDGDPEPEGGGKGKGNQQGGGMGDCGSGAGGEQRPWELPADGGGDPSKAAVGKIEGEAVRRMTAEAVRDAGSASGSEKRWADEVLKPPRIHWSKLLPAAIRQTVAKGTPMRFRYPARRDHGAIILPRLMGAKPSAALVIDSSGSMTDRDLAMAIAITKQAVNEVDLTIWACDTQATRVKKLTPGSVVGGGGTNMMEGIRVALDQHPKPAAVIIISDCYSPWDKNPPAVPVVILTENPDQAPKWAKVVAMEKP